MVNGVPLVLVTRGQLVESVHLGHVAVADTAGRLKYFAGNPDMVTFARSTAKPLQAIPLIASGAAEKFALNDREIAVACASHNGEAAHVAVVNGLLHKIGLDASWLKCGVHEPFHRPAALELMRSGQQPGALHNNCSGKHAAMLALAVHLGAPLDAYDHPDHPVQLHARKAVYGMAGLDPDKAIMASDGCGVPVFAMPLNALARAYARFGASAPAPAQTADAAADACRRIIAALRREPYYLAGTDRFDSELIRATGGRIVGKMGAEGVYAAAVPERGLGIALKIADGSKRALYPAMVEVLCQLGVLRPEELEALRPFHRPPVLNRRGEPVGVLEPRFKLNPGG